MRYIIKTIQNEINAIKSLIKYLDTTKVKQLGPKSIEKIKEESGLAVFYRKDKIDVLTKFALSYDEVQKDGYKNRAWMEFNVFTIEELKEELNKILPYREKSLLKAKKTLKDAKKIEKKLLRIIELSKEVGYKNYNSEMVREMASKMSDSYYLPSTLK